MVKTRAQCLKRRRAETWNVVEAIDIRSRVSVKSVRNFKTLSKYLAKLQLEHSRMNPSFIVCPTMETEMKLYSMDARSSELSPFNTIAPSQRSHEESMYMIASFNGLICCVNQIYDEDVENKFLDMQIWICNPSTQETLLLPQGRPSFEFEPSVGVAYGSDIGDYRVFRIFCAGKKIPEERVYDEEFSFQDGRMFPKYRYVVVYECEVYSSSIGSWKNIGVVPCVPIRGLGAYRSGHVFVGGKIYWLVSLDEPGEILSVDMEGRFEVINLPQYPENLHDDDKITEGTHLVILQESLALVVLHAGYMDIWVWKDNGEKYSWVFEQENEIPIEDYEIVLGVTSLENQILCVTETHWCIYDVDTRVWDMRSGPPTGFLFPAMFPFTETILPCKLCYDDDDDDDDDEVEAEAEAEVELELELKVKIEVEEELELVLGLELDLEVVEAEKEAEVSAEAETEVKVDSEAEVEVEVKVKGDMELEL